MLNWVECNRDEIITVWNLKGKMLYISDAIERLIGINKSELIGSRWYDRMNPEDVNYLSHHLNRNIHKRQKFIINLLHKNGKYISTECKIQKLTDDTSGTSYYIGLLKDITDKRQVEELMIRSEKMSVAGQLAAGVAHEIRNPLTSIKGFMQLLQAGVSRKEEYYNIMLDEIEKMEKITSELLFLSKPVTDDRNEESLNSMIEDIVSLLRPQARMKNIEIVIDNPISDYITCDRSQIKQVLINLVKNAIEAMDTPGEIIVSVVSSETKVVISIMDEGPGIPEDILEKLGEPFFTTKKNGTGLGLLITKQILERHNAVLSIFKNSDRGSTFQLSFPK
ncbi:PAS domain-containing sensor histidine kinase [Oceanobacillus chungangensis]|uniref:histidine kinase n=2 Tax=Oceanobacillus chungangensis TaxID=1229152 RepID=A0A3D8PRW6_9BACI|nr:PAS domain-containing sensor histidine kinase [Oceanobacillus chungangensis]